MAVPKYQELMQPTLEFLASRDEPCKASQINEHLAERFALGEEDLADTTPGGNNRFQSNASWARTYMKQAGLISCPSRNHYVITDAGRDFAAAHPDGITSKDLEAFPGFIEFKNRGREKRPASGKAPVPAAEPELIADESPEDVIQAQFGLIEGKLADELLETVMEMSDYRFESFVVELLQAMGYGGTDSSSGVVTKQTKDGGIDGIIHEDKLGFDNIYIQAKHWDPERTVTRPDVQNFAGALAGESASKGLFITTAKFSDGAREYVSNLSTAKIVLVDGQQLAQLMIEYNFGVTVRKTYEIKSIDRDFFDEGE